MYNQLPDVTIVQVIQDDAEISDRMEFEATIEYPANGNDNKDGTEILEKPVAENTIDATNKDGSEILEKSIAENTVDAMNNERNNETQGTEKDTNKHLLDDSVGMETPSNHSEALHLKNCIIRLTNLSAEERNKWLGLTEKGSTPNVSTDSNSSRYYMRTRTNPPQNNKRPGRKILKTINYHESPPSKELNDSDYEPLAKHVNQLDSKRNPSSTRIAIQN